MGRSVVILTTPPTIGTGPAPQSPIHKSAHDVSDRSPSHSTQVFGMGNPQRSTMDALPVCNGVGVDSSADGAYAGCAELGPTFGDRMEVGCEQRPWSRADPLARVLERQFFSDVTWHTPNERDVLRGGSLPPLSVFALDPSMSWWKNESVQGCGDDVTTGEEVSSNVVSPNALPPVVGCKGCKKYRNVDMPVAKERFKSVEYALEMEALR
ncbi:hypothetical protein TRVL_03268 [Trypanosoma vivax]|nr:hypothetical protein TRVL_03268 [Trypanosoma vivax]